MTNVIEKSPGALALADYLRNGQQPHPPAGVPVQAQRDQWRTLCIDIRDPLRAGARAGGFMRRVAWFRRWLALGGDAARESFDSERMHSLLRRRHAVACLPDELLDGMERAMTDSSLDERRLRLLQAVWLAAIAPGPVSFDAAQRRRDATAVERCTTRWLARLETQRKNSP